MKMNIWKIFTLATIIAITPAYAGVVDGKASIDYWYVQGDVNHDLNREKDLTLEKKGSPQLELSIEHNVPLIPNVAIRHAEINQNASNRTLKADTNISTTDLILSYDVMDHGISTDLGIGLKRLDGDISYAYGKTDISKTIPMVYASVGTKLPLAGLSANVQALATKYNRVQGIDVQAEVKYNVVEKLLYDVGAKIGYRMLDLKLEKQSGKDQTLRFKGPFIGIQMNF